MSNEGHLQIDPNQAMDCQIRIAGHLDPEWTDWLGGLSITLEEDGMTLLTGQVLDQSALYGVLKKVRDLGMPLLLVNCAKHVQANVPDIKE